MKPSKEKLTEAIRTLTEVNIDLDRQLVKSINSHHTALGSIGRHITDLSRDILAFEHVRTILMRLEAQK